MNYVCKEDMHCVIGKRVAGDGAKAHWSSPVIPEKIVYQGAGDAQVHTAVHLAKRAQIDWAAQSPMARQAAMMELATKIEAEADVLGRLDMVDMGKPITVATQEAHIAAFILRYYATAIDKVGGFVAPSAQEALAISTRVPYGVVASIISWNYPSINVMMKVAPALAAGNAVVLKPSSQAPRSALRMADLALDSALPTGIFSVLSGSASCGTFLCNHPHIAMLAFTGSTAVGQNIATIAAKKLIPSLIEAGGKNPIFVCDDIDDIDGMAHDAIIESYANSGQLCVARSKIIAPKHMITKLTKALVTAADAFYPGDPREITTQYGPLSSQQHALAIHSVIEKATKQAKLVRDGRSKQSLLHSMSLIYTEDSASSFLTDEYFGPILTIVPYDDIENGLAKANAGGHGLAATIWTTDIRRAKAISARIHAGHIKVKSQPKIDSGTAMALPVEPMGKSGYGTEFGVAALESYSRRQAVEYIGWKD